MSKWVRVGLAGPGALCECSVTDRVGFRASLSPNDWSAPMADGGFVQTDTVTRRMEGDLMVFQRLDGLWMIDRVGEVANDVEAFDDDAGGAEGEDTVELGTAISRAEVWGLEGDELRAFHARQLRKLGLHARSSGAAALWRIITDFDRFDPWAA